MFVTGGVELKFQMVIFVAEVIFRLVFICLFCNIFC